MAIVVARILTFPAACLSGFGQWHEPFQFFAHIMAVMPGLPGNYLRGAYYSFTLDRVGKDCHIAFGSFFSHAHASLGDHVGIGAYCVLGQVDIGEGTLFASQIQVLSGRRQHRRDASGHLTDEGRVFRRISIGPHCWIGSGAMIMADVGAMATVGAGSVVAQDVPPGTVVCGNPAQVMSAALQSVS